MTSTAEQARARYAPPAPGTGLPSVLPAALRALGAELPEGIPEPQWSLPPTRRVVVLMVDGLGARQLARASGHAPFLRTLTSPVDTAECGFPSTTATSLASLGTGRYAGEHGIIGWQTALGGTSLFNHLAWRNGPDPGAYQPLPTLFQEAGRRDISMTTVSRPEFDGSGFTRAALRGGAYRGCVETQDRIDHTRAALQEAGRRGRALVYCYWSEVDKAGHVHGPNSLDWGVALEELDDFAARLVQTSPQDTVVVVTADHGMIDAPHTQRRDVAIEPELGEGITVLAGEPRAPQAWCVPGAAADVAAAWRELLGQDAVVLERDEAIDAGWFGPVEARNTRRVGDVIAAMLGDGATLLDSRLLRPEVLALRGHHGSITPDETQIPLLVHVPD